MIILDLDAELKIFPVYDFMVVVFNIFVCGEKLPAFNKLILSEIIAHFLIYWSPKGVLLLISLWVHFIKNLISVSERQHKSVVLLRPYFPFICSYSLMWLELNCLCSRRLVMFDSCESSTFQVWRMKLPSVFTCHLVSVYLSLCFASSLCLLSL